MWKKPYHGKSNPTANHTHASSIFASSIFRRTDRSACECGKACRRVGMRAICGRNAGHDGWSFLRDNRCMQMIFDARGWRRSREMLLIDELRAVLEFSQRCVITCGCWMIISGTVESAHTCKLFCVCSYD